MTASCERRYRALTLVQVPRYISDMGPGDGRPLARGHRQSDRVLRGTLYRMLKRAQVAERIGKSIATVRRLQHGGELNSRRDRRGVHLFDEWEVAELVERYSCGERITAARGASISPSRARVGGAARRVGDGDDREVAELRREKPASG